MPQPPPPRENNPPLPNMKQSGVTTYDAHLILDPTATPAEGEIPPGKIPLSVTQNLMRLERRWQVRMGDRAIHRQLELLWDNRRWSDSQLKQQAETLERARDMKPHFMPNILRQIINPLTYLYDAPPQRKAAQAGDEAWMRACVWDFGEVGRLDWLMGEADRLARLHGTIWAQVIYRPSIDEARDFRHMLKLTPDALERVAMQNQDGFDLMFFAPHRFEVAPSCLDPTVADAVVVFVGDDEYEGDILWSHTAMDTPRDGHYWDGEFYGRLENFRLVPLDKEGHLVCRHGIGEIPGLPVRNEVTTDKFWVWGVGGRDAHQDLLDIAKLWREYPFTAMTARGTFFMRGEFKEGTNTTIGPDTVFQGTGADCDMKGIKSEADLAGIRTTLNTMCEAFARGCNVPATLVRLDEKQSNLSGRAMILQSAEIEDDRPTRVRIFSQIERGLHRRIAAIRMAVAGQQVDLPSQVPGLEGVTYAIYQPQLTRAEVSLDVAFKLDRRMISRLQAMRELHPGVEDSVLIERLREADTDPSPTPTATQVNDNARTNPPGGNTKPSNTSGDPTRESDSTDPTSHPSKPK